MIKNELILTFVVTIMSQHSWKINEYALLHIPHQFVGHVPRRRHRTVYLILMYFQAIFFQSEKGTVHVPLKERLGKVVEATPVAFTPRIAMPTALQAPESTSLHT